MKIAFEHSTEVSAAHKTVRSVVSIVFAAYVLCSGSARAQSIVPITSEPSHHLALSNSYVRVFKVEVPPKAETLYHQHDYDYLYVTIGDSDVTSTRIHEQPVAIKLKDGQVELAKGPFAHKATNNSDKPFRNVTIELLKGAGESVCGHPGKESCGLFTGLEGAVIQTTKVLALDIRLEEKSGIGPFREPYLLVAVSDSNLQQTSRNGTRSLSLTSGDVFWNEQPEVKLQNLSGQARFIVVSFSSSQTQ